MADMTLKEVCDMAGITRRALQGYEGAGLVYATGQNKYKHKLYNNEAQEKILEVKRYQDMGFSLKEITGLYQMNNTELKNSLQGQVEFLREKAEKINQSIAYAEAKISNLK